MKHSVITFQICFCIFLLDIIRLQNTNGASLNTYKFDIIRYRRQNQNISCPITKFTCDSGQCIDDIELCDGKGDCDDNSDETVKVCKAEKCPSPAFKCNYGACIHINAKCNGFRDCFDGSDEESCSHALINYVTSAAVKGCQLPDNPSHGKYAVINHLSAGYTPGDIIPVYGVLFVNCNKGYVVNPPEDDSPSYCLPTNQWNPAPKECARMSLFSTGCRLPKNPPHGNYVVINHLSAGYNPDDIVPVYALLQVNCNYGYVINPFEDDEPSHCSHTEEWTPAPKTCALKPVLNKGCQIPDNPSHGNYVGITHLSDGYRSGDIVPVDGVLSLNCNIGYEVYPLEEDNQSNCLHTGEWIPIPKTCGISTPRYSDEGCAFPSNPAHGKYVVYDHLLSEYKPGEIVPANALLSVKCNTGYQPNPQVNDKPSNCLSTGEWAPVPKTCTPISFVREGCRLPNNPLHGKYTVVNHISVGYNFGNIVPIYGLLSLDCNSGYEINPFEDDSPSSCLPTGEWTPAPKTCIPRPINNKGCLFPNNPLNGKYFAINNSSVKYNPGDIAPVQYLLGVDCNQGYLGTPSGDTNPSYCSRTGTWTPALKICEITPLQSLNKGCIFPRNPSYGRYTVINHLLSEYNTGDIVPVNSLLSVNCNSGYQAHPPEDDNPSNCLLTGEWTPTPKECISTSILTEGCRLPNNPSNGEYIVINHLSLEFHAEDLVPIYGLLSINCHEGYEVNPVETGRPSYCLPTGEWTPSLKTCTPKPILNKGCLLPKNLLNGIFRIYNIDHSLFIEINNSSDKPDSPGYIVPVYSILDVKCNQGYLIPSENSNPPYCSPTGAWTPAPKTCEIATLQSSNKGCIFPRNPAHGRYGVATHILSEYNTGDIVPVNSLLSVKCDRGYQANPAGDDQPSNCLPTGEWTPEPKKCISPSFHSEGCRIPDNPAYGTYNVINSESVAYDHGDTVPVHGLLSVNCITGYEVNLSGNANPSYCLPSGEWHPVPKTCILAPILGKGCQLPNNPSHGKYIVINNNSSVTYSPGDLVPVYSLLSVNCTLGYESLPRHNYNPSYCSPKGEWTPHLQTCAVTVPLNFNEGCFFPRNLKNGIYVVHNDISSQYRTEVDVLLPINSLLSVNCDIGYQANPLTDDKLSKCLPTQEWSPVPKKCFPQPTSSFRKGCRFPNNPSYGKYSVINHLSDEYNSGDLVPIYGILSVNCNEGYEVSKVVDHSPSLCLPVGEWNPAPKTCIPTPILNKGCVFPNNPPHGKYISNTNLTDRYNPGDIRPVHDLLQVLCDEGYEGTPSGDTNPSYCLPTGAWSPTPKTCKSVISPYPIKGCSFYGDPPHGKYTVLNHLLKRFAFGATVPLNSLISLKCDTGYQPDIPTDDKPSKCLQNEEWTPELKSCVPLVLYSEGCLLPHNSLYANYDVINPEEIGYIDEYIVPVHGLLSVNCAKGYKVNSSEPGNPSYCLPSGEWNPVPKTCISSRILGEGCQLPNDPLHGQYIVINKNSTVRYSPEDLVPVYSLLSVNCTKGYEGIPRENNNPSYCLPMGEWTPDPQTCAVATPLVFNEGCILPSNPENGTYFVHNDISSQYSAGDVVLVNSLLSVNCHIGYQANPITDDKPSKCLPTGEWSPVPKTCLSTSFIEKGCRFPNNPSYGTYSVINHLSDEYNSGDLVPVYGILSLNCNEGYEVNKVEDDSPSFCLPEEEWNPAPKTCTPTPILNNGCGFPNNPPHGKYISSTNLTVTYNAGDILPVHDLLHVLCDEGYEGSPSGDTNPSYCLPTGAWSPTPKTCEIAKSRDFFSGCSLYGDPPHGKYTIMNNFLHQYTFGNILPVNSLLSLNCDTGYQPDVRTNDEPSICLKRGGWSPKPKGCVPISFQSEGCLLPVNPLYGSYDVINSDAIGYEDEHIVPVYGLLSVNCIKGYEVNSSEAGNPSYCLPSGEWNPAPKTCIRLRIFGKGCELPNDPKYGKYIVINHQEFGYRPGDIVPENGLLFMECDMGYQGYPFDHLKYPNSYSSLCLPTGEWDPPPKTCGVITPLNVNDTNGCLLPSNPENGKYVVHNDLSFQYSSGDIVPTHNLLSVHCNSGYVASPATDDKPSYCLPSGEWLPIPKACTSTSVLHKVCQIPNNPAYGAYYAVNSEIKREYKPGDSVQFESKLYVNCTAGYAAHPPENDTSSYCGSAGEWIPAPKICARTCPSLTSTKTTNVECEFDNKLLNTCSNVVENTTVRLSCASFYEELSMEQHPTRLCKDGGWSDPIPQCYPICGRKGVTNVMNIAFNRDVNPDDYPWHVGVYNSDRKYTCDGSIIHERIVLSAASCFFSSGDPLEYRETNYSIAAGKYYSRYHDERDTNAQYSNVHAVHIPEGYQGKINNYEANIAIIILSTAFKLSVNVQPVCIDLESADNHQFVTDGIVAGWRLTYGDQYDVLKRITVSHITHDKCLVKMPKPSRKYIIYDKICGEYKDKVSVTDTWICQDVIGNALVFPNESTDRIFVKGIQSTYPDKIVTSCESYGIYTSVTEYIDFIKRELAAVNTVQNLVQMSF